MAIDLSKFRKRKPKVGLALGAGAARGWAHLGVIAAVEECGIPVHCIAGTSAGALVAGVYASGQIGALTEVVLRLDWKEVLRYFSDITLSRSGLVDGKKISDFIRRYITSSRLEDLRLPFRAVATDIVTGEEVILSHGDIIDAIRASISFPGIFTPVRVDDRLLVDGGLVNPVPVRVVRELGADIVIAVDVNHDREGSRARERERKADGRRHALHQLMSRDTGAGHILSRLERRMEKAGWRALLTGASRARKPRTPHIFDVLGASIRIMEATIAEAMLDADPPDVLIRPDVGYIDFMDFMRAEETVEAGYRAALPPLRELAAKLGLRHPVP